MSFATIINALAIIVYLAGSAYLIAAYLRQQPPQTRWVTAIATVAVALHGIGAYSSVFGANDFRFGVFILPTLFFWVINLMVLVSGLRKPLYNLFVFLFPLSVVAILSAQLSESPSRAVDPALMMHILLALLAYGLLTIASFQAVLLAFQNYQLKHKHATGVIQLLPPLQTMEGLMFEMVWAGELLLTALIVSGLVYTTDLVEQNQAHTMAFSVIAWLIYAILLWGRHQLGWRGKVAVRWTLGGFVALALAYFGTQLIYQVVLQ
ncbi:cytochrome C assembly family protein [Gilvimarinus sp. F26214L]|uniref:cytochrome C assembly family protein n=1 Tax=Gilvimarinus sp. DZF01 TaxID=3461371 RepID=UPI0040452EF5